MKADVMKLEAPAVIDASEIQAQMGEQVQRGRDVGRKAVLAYVGFWGCAYDRAVELARRGEKLWVDAVARGERMEAALNKRLERFGRRTSKQVNELQNQLGDNIEQVTRTVGAKGEGFEEQLEKQIERVLVNLGIPTRDRLERLNQEIDRLNAKLDEELARREAVHA
jgi:polyhydroxyalkanoate synthesis regulator phasin